MVPFCKNEKQNFTKKGLLEGRPIPEHVAIIMDGARRWTEKRRRQGHWAGAYVLKKIVEESQRIGIKILTVYAFSTENKNRSQEETEEVMQIIETFLKENQQEMREKGVCFETIGDLSFLSPSLQKELYLTKQLTKKGKGITLVVGINYGSRDEMRRAVVAIAEDYAQKKISKQQITEENISLYLDTAMRKDPDLLIRTGEKRISNFLLWQLAYTELYFVEDVLWPDFTPQHFIAGIVDYQKRHRRYGK